MLTEETVIKITDDVTGKEIKNCGWALVRITDGQQFHTQNVAEMIELILDGRLFSSTSIAVGVRHKLIDRGIIGPVLGPDEFVCALVPEDSTEPDCCTSADDCYC